MMRPPSVSLFFFAFAAAFVIYGAFSNRERPAPEMFTPQPAGEETLVANGATLPDYNWRFDALDPGIVDASSVSVAFDPADDYWGLPRADGVDLVASYCAACHSLRIVMQQHATETRWRELMAWMIEKQGMGPPPDDDLEMIINYLSDQFGD